MQKFKNLIWISPTSFNIFVNQADFSIAITWIQFKKLAAIIKVWLFMTWRCTETDEYHNNYNYIKCKLYQTTKHCCNVSQFKLVAWKTLLWKQILRLGIRWVFWQVGDTPPPKILRSKYSIRRLRCNVETNFVVYKPDILPLSQTN